ncbi:MAG TPA: type II toxin-antitoxin system HicA family toxin [Pyrinomonadaceae bacterium]|nr:type II toxin-antitoxin system HicA family toxin [Pyrinomonadaceae bacterium]
MYWRIVWSTASANLNLSASRSPLHESLPSAKAKRVLAALLRIGWSIKRQSGSHKTLSREGWPDVVFAFHDSDEIGPKMLPRIAKHTGLKPTDL